MKTKLWDELWTFGQRTDVAMTLAGGFAGFLICGEVVDSLMRDPVNSSNLLAGFSHAGWFLTRWNIVMGGIIAFALTKIVSTLISINASSEEELLAIRSKEDSFVYKLPPWPVSKGLQLTLGESHGGDPNTQNFVNNPRWYTLPTSGLWGNLIAFGMIGSGKTQSVIYPLLEAILGYYPLDPLRRVGGLVLEVKGDFWKVLKDYMEKVGRFDLLVIEPGGKHVWNPIHSPNTPADVLAGRLVAVYENQTGGTSSDNAWVTSGVRKLLWHCLGIHRCVFGYVTISDINTIIVNTSSADPAQINDNGDQTTPTQEYINANYNDVWLQTEHTSDEEHEYQMHYVYFMTEWSTLDVKQKATFVSSTTDITGCFEKLEFKNTFCPPLDEITFHGFDDVIDKGNVVVLNAPEVTHGTFGQMLGILLKLDFQRAVLQRVSREGANLDRPLALVIDEYQCFVTASSQSTPQGDDNFYSKSRQSKCMCLLATQAPVSLESVVGKEKMRVILASLLTKICLGLSDFQDAEAMASLFGKSRQSFESHSISENSTGFINPLTGNMSGKNTGLSQSSTYSNEDTYIVQPTTFMSLKRHEAIVYSYDITGMKKAERVYLKTTYVPKTLQELYKSPREVPYNQLIKAIEFEAKQDMENGRI